MFVGRLGASCGGYGQIGGLLKSETSSPLLLHGESLARRILMQEPGACYAAAKLASCLLCAEAFQSALSCSSADSSHSAAAPSPPSSQPVTRRCGSTAPMLTQLAVLALSTQTPEGQLRDFSLRLPPRNAPSSMAPPTPMQSPHKSPRKKKKPTRSVSFSLPALPFPLASFLHPLRSASSQWLVLPVLLMVVLLFRWAVGLGPYSGM